MSIRAVRRKEGTRALELGILKEIQAELGLNKAKDKKRKAPPVASFISKDEPMIPVCCESDDEFFDDEKLPAKKLAAFSGKYRKVGQVQQEKNRDDEEEDSENGGDDDEDQEGDGDE